MHALIQKITDTQHYITSSSFSLTQISFITFQSVLEVILVSLSGFICAWSGKLPREAQKIISKINVDLLTPCLIFNKLAKNLSITKIIEIFVVPAFYALLISVSFMTGHLWSHIFGLDEDETGFVIGNCVFPNSNSLPVSLTLSLAYTLPGLLWDHIENDNRDKVASRGILYLLIFQQIDQMLRWSWGYNKLLRWREETVYPDGSILNLVRNHDTSTLSLDSSTCDIDSNVDSGTNNTKLYRIWNTFKSNMNPPLYAIFSSIIVASIPILKNQFYVDDGFIQHTLSESISELGMISIPLILLVLGSNLYPSNETQSATHNYRKMIIASILGRMLTPWIIILPIVVYCCKTLPSVSILGDPIFMVCAFLLCTSPPAIQLTQITQLNEFFEAEMAGVLFWGYVVLTLPMTIITVISSMCAINWKA
ncbi:AEC family transporter SCDLUD_003587 [Saccharomycodes ludwigii]|uniref:AEC family transporter n=1 Tax=Saccharomycodes ludwigii TaxID=36035 RepID=UPI001E8788B0|nr:hypothetical protein SCDLUD_003587 [Saccharomycodes ludwigii]KAH3900595.1 hypothetical protein SCDLUD_003587 [Saccharomycodes ludwigii]